MERKKIIRPVKPRLNRRCLTIVRPPSNLIESPEIFSAKELMTTEFPELAWVIPDILPEGLILLAGKPKVGKSIMALNTSLAVALGGKALGTVAVDQGEVLYLALEDSPRRLKKRLSLMLKGLSASERLHLVTKWPRLDEGGNRRLEEWIKGHPQARLIIIDTLAKIRPMRRGRSYRGDCETLEELKVIGDRYHVSILLVHHLRKTPSKDRLDEILGTTGLTGSADTVAVLKKGGGLANATAELRVSGRDIADRELALRFDESNTTWKLLGDAEDYHKSLPRQEIIELLREEEIPLTPKQIAGKLRKKEGAIRKLLFTMFNDGEVTKVDRGQYTMKKIHRRPRLFR